MKSQITLPYGDRTYTFKLDDFTIDALERACSSGLATILQRLVTGNWHRADIVQPIQLGLTGVKLTNRQAVIDKYTSPGNLEVSRQTAMMIVGAAIYGVDENGKLMIERKPYTPLSDALAAS
jgi:hypothetical protein